MDGFLHASTPARRHHCCTLLGTRQGSCASPTRSRAHAVVSISPLFAGAGSRRFAPGSWLALLAAGRNHNQCALIACPILVSSSTRAASSQALGAVVVGRWFAGGLTDWLTRSQTRQIWLSGAINGMSRCLALLQHATIHNYQLSMLFPPFQQNTMKNRKRRQHFFCFSSPFSQGHIGWPFVKGKRSGLDKRASDMAPAPLLPATWGAWWSLCLLTVRSCCSLAKTPRQ